MEKDDFKKQDDFENYVFKEISYRDADISGNIIKSGNVDFIGNAKIEVEEESADGVKIILKKDDQDNIREIKFVCSCGQTKSVLLDYSEESEEEKDSEESENSEE